MTKKNLEKSITVGITGNKDIHWKSKLSEIEKLKIDRVSLFLEQFSTKIQRGKIYKAILKSRIKEIPLIHIRNEMDKNEISFLLKKFKNPYLTIHESSFKYMGKWKGFHKNLYLEMNYDDSIPGNVDVKKIGGFCVDLAHFKTSEERWTKEFLYESSKNKKRYFKCNHLSGFSFKKGRDVHLVKNKEDFNYLKTLPKFIFGDVMAIEIYNSIAEQLEFKKHIIKLLSSR
ncbi:MAG: hypothetical protein D4Q79_02345 [Spirochaetia bacterium]|nr:MAG: hypothetical protein D4Q79_02345 [Spirochaetia bacterium]